MMDSPIFKVAKKRYTGDSSVISLRLPKDMLADIDKIAKATGRTRNEILIMGIEFSINHLVISSPDTNNGF